MNNYKQITQDERVIIEFLRNNENYSISKIAKELNRNKSTISRELQKNKAGLPYAAKDAQFTREINNKNSHDFGIDHYKDFINFLYGNFETKYSGIDVCVFKSKESGIKTPSTKTVYNWINSNQLLIKPKDLLRPRGWWGKSSKYKRFFYEISKMNAIPISFRPKEINDRSSFGHFEIDLIVSSKSTKSILTLVERKTRKAFAIKLDNKTMKHTNDKLEELIIREKLKIKSITKDNGMEFNLLHEITKKIGAKLYTCNTYASCEKGSNENLNGLIRRTLPKKTCFNDLTQQNLDVILFEINKMPRKLLNYNSAQNFYETLG